MKIRIDYGHMKLEFADEASLATWCAEQTELFGNMVISSFNGQTVYGRAVFDQLLNDRHKFRADRATGFSGKRFVLPPTLDESLGRYLAGVKELDPSAFEHVETHWFEFGRGESKLRSSLSVDQIIALQVISNAKLANINPLVSRLDSSLQNAEKIRKELEDVKEVFEEQMTLKGPVDYWDKKGSGHKGQKKVYSIRLASAAIAFVIVVCALPAIYVYCLAESLSAKAQALEISLAQMSLPWFGLYFLLVSLGLWVLRILTKLFLSEHHLMTDANERKTMAMTYLALTEKGAASDADRSIVLNSLFRPTQDGVVKDEGFDGSLHQAIARSLSK